MNSLWVIESGDSLESWQNINPPLHRTEAEALKRAAELAKGYGYSQQNSHFWKGRGKWISVTEYDLEE